MQRSTESKILIALAAASLLGSGLSLGLSLHQVRAARAAQADARRIGPGFEALRPDPGNLMPILVGMSRRLDALESGRGAAAAEPPPAGERAPAPAGAAAAPPAEEAPRLVRFTAPRRGVSIAQTEGGGISVRNDDPSLTGQMMVVQAEAEDGTSRPMTVMVPAPER